MVSQIREGACSCAPSIDSSEPIDRQADQALQLSLDADIGFEAPEGRRLAIYSTRMGGEYDADFTKAARDNPIYNDNSYMLFGDAKKMVEHLVKEIQELG